MADRKLKVHRADAPHDMLVLAVERAASLIESKTPLNTIAKKLKNLFDKTYFPNWHCIVGHHFGAFASNEEGKALYFTYGQTFVLLFKAG